MIVLEAVIESYSGNCECPSKKFVPVYFVDVKLCHWINQTFWLACGARLMLVY